MGWEEKDVSGAVRVGERIAEIGKKGKKDRAKKRKGGRE